jgi:hypothetical protein
MIDGVYTFQTSNLGKFHEMNQIAARYSDARVVIIDNTNLDAWSRSRYLSYKRYYVPIFMKSHDVSVLRARNVHRVPFDILEKMCGQHKPERDCKPDFLGYFPVTPIPVLHRKFGKHAFFAAMTKFEFASRSPGERTYGTIHEFPITGFFVQDRVVGANGEEHDATEPLSGIIAASCIRCNNEPKESYFIACTKENSFSVLGVEEKKHTLIGSVLRVTTPFNLVVRLLPIYT